LFEKGICAIGRLHINLIARREGKTGKRIAAAIEKDRKWGIIPITGSDRRWRPSRWRPPRWRHETALPKNAPLLIKRRLHIRCEWRLQLVER
jgi:hypothetical protein